MPRVTTHVCRCLLVLALCAPGGFAQSRPAQTDAEVRTLLTQPQVVRAFAVVEQERAKILREWAAITEINAPSGHERARAAYIERLLRGYRLTSVRYDATGNLIAVRKGTGGAPATVFDAHLDTVFQPGLKIKPTIRAGRIYAPGVGDDTRNIVALLATMRALDAAQIRTQGDLIFVFTVEEETSLRGARAYVAEHKDQIGQYVALDGGYETFSYGGIGINWYRHHFIGPGGHTRSATPPYSAALPLARAIERIYQLPVPRNPASNLNIGMLGGAEVVNAKAADAWFTVDLRSTDATVIADLAQRIAVILNEEAQRAGMSVKTDIISQTAPAQLPGQRDSPLVRTAAAVHQAMGFNIPPTNTGSNNATAALLAGVSAISTGAGPCDDAHALTESCEIEPLYHGIKKILLLELAIAGLAAGR